jgi:hypothetical protein
MTTEEKIQWQISNWDTTSQHNNFKDKQFESGKDINIEKDIVLFGFINEGNNELKLITFYKEEYGTIYKSELKEGKQLDESTETTIPRLIKI